MRDLSQFPLKFDWKSGGYINFLSTALAFDWKSEEHINFLFTSVGVSLISYLKPCLHSSVFTFMYFCSCN